MIMRVLPPSFQTDINSTSHQSHFEDLPLYRMFMKVERVQRSRAFCKMYYEKQSFRHWLVIFNRKEIIHIAGQRAPVPHSQQLPNDAPFSSSTSKHASSRLWLKRSRDLGLGELCFLQPPTTNLLAAAGRGVGACHSRIHGSLCLLGFDELRYFAYGTGVAGIADAFLWWET